MISIQLVVLVLLSIDSQYMQGPQLEREGPVQGRLYRSLRLWSFYCDLEESLGTLESTRAVYDAILDLRLATPQIILNYAAYLQVSSRGGTEHCGCGTCSLLRPSLGCIGGRLSMCRGVTIHAP